MPSVSFDRCGQAKGHIDQMGATLDGVRTYVRRPAPDDTRRPAPGDTRRPAPDDTRRPAPECRMSNVERHISAKL